ncbi:alpha/beta fold hydrolase [Acidobacteria bacterium AH-259-A15]|nr:alpha/beta fold hydrolase [Acidobacteria bacterium AH-259-A15]
MSIPADETFDGTFPFTPHFSEAPGFRMHYVDKGEGEPIICLHGEPTWGYLYRKFIPPLSRTYRVLVPDHMGFGKSQTPQDREYTLRTHVENLESLIEELDLSEITFVVQDWGGPMAGAYTVRHPDRVKRLCLMNTVIGGPEATSVDPSSSPWFQWVKMRYENGSLDEVLGNLGSTVLSVMKIIGFENSSAVSRTWIRAYSAPFPTREECIGAIAFPLDLVLGKAIQYLEETMSGVEELRKKPAMLAEGMRDRAILPEWAISSFKSVFPEGPVVRLESAGHYCQEDAPETLVALIQQFIQMT